MASSLILNEVHRNIASTTFHTTPTYITSRRPRRSRSRLHDTKPGEKTDFMDTNLSLRFEEPSKHISEQPLDRFRKREGERESARVCVLFLEHTVVQGSTLGGVHPGELLDKDLDCEQGAHDTLVVMEERRNPAPLATPMSLERL